MTSIAWTANNIDWLTRLWAEGQSASEIGALLGATRSAIIGKVHRLKLPGRRAPGPKHRTIRNTMAVSLNNTRPTRHRSTATKATDRPRKPKSAPLKAVVRAVAVDKPLPAIAHPEASMAAIGISFMEMADNKQACKFPLNDGSPWVFCGAHAKDGKVYCEFHQRRAYTAARTS